jgi:3-oxoacyl-[acyl-carrier protein] reductase
MGGVHGGISAMTSAPHRVLITGGRRGLGRRLALHLAGQGHVVHVLGRAPHESLDPELRAAVTSCLVADLADRTALAAALAQAARLDPPIDALIANAAIRPSGHHLLDQDPDVLQSHIDVNLTAPLLILRALMPSMIRHGHGRVILIGSRAVFRRVPREVTYAASKAGLVALVESLAREVDRPDVTVNAICPGRFSTASRPESAREAQVIRGVLTRVDRLLESRLTGRVLLVAPWRHRIKDATRAVARALRLLTPG